MSKLTKGGEEKPRAPYNLKAQIINKLRQLFMYHPGLKAVRTRTRVEVPKKKADGTPAKKPGVFHRCESCQGLFKGPEMRYDHVEPVVELDGFKDWNTYIARMFDVIPDGIQHLCKPCHTNKTTAERGERTARRRERKAQEAG